MGLALAAVAALIALAATQPIVETERTVSERTDAEAFVLVDVSRSMLAAADAGAPTRLERARLVAEGLRQRVPQVPIGLLSLTDRVLPHLFPTTDGTVFVATLEQAIGIERPPPALFFSTRATSLNALEAIPARDFFEKTARKRLLVVLTDGESQDVTADLRRAYSRRPAIETYFVHLWDAEEGIYETGVAGARLPARPGERARAGERGGAGRRPRLRGDGDGRARGRRRGLLRQGATRERVIEGDRRALMPFVTLAALLPLGFVLLRRNL